MATNWDSNKVRQTFLDFFQSKDHKIVPSAPMVVKDDPTLMFINAGMNQFKDVFLGNNDPEKPRVADTQKCLRVSGKHNDLEEVGVDTYHHTMFEMLGNWSFGDYFKKEAIEWAWELLTEVYKIDKDRLYVTVFKGDEEDGLSADNEASAVWETLVNKDKILFASKKDNFWEMGDTGPCGPSSEIHVDLREDSERKNTDGKELVNRDHPLVVEIWNLVFIEFNRLSSGELKQLPKQHVDTGMGLERLCMALQGKRSNYDTDIFQLLIRRIEEVSSSKYGEDEKEDIAMRVIADHMRAVSFSIADGQLPSNTGAGYVIRRILRRAIRYAYSFLGLESPFIHSLIPVLVEQMGGSFPELKKQQSLIVKVVKEEEENFLKTLEKGIQRIEEIVKSEKEQSVSGKKVFELYDTFGFPVDLTALILREKGLDVDRKGFEEELNKQKERSRSATKLDTGDWEVLSEDNVEEFVGYDRLEATVKITRYRKVRAKGKEFYQLVFNLTPFYPEGGGQIGDIGYIKNQDEKITIRDTKKENQLILHIVDKLPVNPQAELEAVVDGVRRKRTAINHTGTHLLHIALREVLGEHVEQKGSLVHPDYLRFDFSHYAKVTDEELEKIEQLVNEKIRENYPLDEKRNIPMGEAKEMGAMALFGEKYGDVVRVIKFGNSVELCGGTHVKASGSIGYFKITSETAVAAGIRRIEAVTAERAEEFVDRQLDVLDEVKSLVKNPKDPLKAITDLLKKNELVEKQLEELNRDKLKIIKKEILNSRREIQGIEVITEKVDLEPKLIKDLAFQIKNERDNLFMVLGGEANGKASLTVMISEDLVKNRGLNAGTVIKELAKEINGGGGGQPFLATAGGGNVEGLEKAFSRVPEILSSHL